MPPPASTCARSSTSRHAFPPPSSSRSCPACRSSTSPTVTSRGEPRVAPVDGHFVPRSLALRDRLELRCGRSTSPPIPTASAAHTRGEGLCVLTHGRVEAIDLREPSAAECPRVPASRVPDVRRMGVGRRARYWSLEPERIYVPPSDRGLIRRPSDPCCSTFISRVRFFCGAAPHAPHRRAVGRGRDGAGDREAVVLVEAMFRSFVLSRYAGMPSASHRVEHRRHHGRTEPVALRGPDRCRARRGRSARRSDARPSSPGTRRGCARSRRRRSARALHRLQRRRVGLLLGRAASRTRRSHATRRCTTRRAGRSTGGSAARTSGRGARGASCRPGTPTPAADRPRTRAPSPSAITSTSAAVILRIAWRTRAAVIRASMAGCPNRWATCASTRSRASG